MILLLFIVLVVFLVVLFLLGKTNSPRKETFVEMGSDSTRNIRKAIVIPFGELKPEQKRSEQLKKYLERIKKYNINDTYIIVAEQKLPKDKFNKGKLFNSLVDYLTHNKQAFKSIEYIVFNDVDMIPNHELFAQYFKTHLPCSYVPKNSMTHKQNYSNDKYPNAGGIFGISTTDYIRANGFPNDFWGWGAEDDVFSNRVSEKVDMPFHKVEAGEYESTDNFRENGFKSKVQHLSANSLMNDKLEYEKKPDGRILQLKIKESALNDLDWMINGFNTVNYGIVSEEFKDGIFYVGFDLT